MTRDQIISLLTYKDGWTGLMQPRRKWVMLHKLCDMLTYRRNKVAIRGKGPCAVEACAMLL